MTEIPLFRLVYAYLIFVAASWGLGVAIAVTYWLVRGFNYLLGNKDDKLDNKNEDVAGV